MRTIITIELDRRITLEESSTLMGLAGELGAPYPGGFKIETQDDGCKESKRILRCSNCGRPIGFLSSPESWYWDIIENARPGMPIRLCGKCNGAVTSATRNQMIEEMKGEIKQ